MGIRDVTVGRSGRLLMVADVNGGPCLCCGVFGAWCTAKPYNLRTKCVGFKGSRRLARLRSFPTDAQRHLPFACLAIRPVAACGALRCLCPGPPLQRRGRDSPSCPWAWHVARSGTTEGTKSGRSGCAWRFKENVQSVALRADAPIDPCLRCSRWL